MNTQGVALKSLVFVVGLTLAMAGGICLLGLWVGWPATQSPRAVPALTAGLVLAGGLGLLADLYRYPRLRVLFALAMLSLLALLARALARAAGELVVPVAIPFDMPDAATLVAWLLLGLATLAGGRRQGLGRRVTLALPLAAVAIMLFALLWYSVSGTRAAHGQSQLSLTIELLTLLAAAVWLARARLPGQAQLALPRRVAAAAVAGTAVCCGLWFALWLEEHRDVRERGTALLEHASEHIRDRMAREVGIVRRMAERWSAADAIPSAGRWEVEALGYLRDHHSLEAIAVLAPGLEITTFRHRAPGASHWLADFLAQPDTRAWAQRAAAADTPSVSQVVALRGRVRHAIVVALDGPSLQGWSLMTVANTSTLFDTDDWGQALAIRVREDERLLHAFPRHEAEGVPVAAHALALVGGPQWQVEASHVPELHPQRGTLANAALFAGIAFIVALMVNLCQARIARRDTEQMAIQRDTLAAIAHSDDLPTQLMAICTMAEWIDRHTTCVIHAAKADGRGMSLAAAPSLSPTLGSLLHELPLPGPDAGREPSDTIEDPPLPDAARDTLAAAGYVTALARPLTAPDGSLLGQVMLLLRAPHASDIDMRLLDDTARYAAIALERVRARAQLASGEQRYRSLVAFNPDAVFSVDFKGRIVSSNPAAQRLLGQGEAELAGRSVRDFVASSDLGRVDAMFDRTVAGTAQHLQLTGVSHHGGTFEAEITTVPIAVDSAFVGIFVIAKDVTERRRIERALQERTQFFLLSPEMLGMVNHQGVLLQVNPAFARVTGYRPESVVGRQLVDLIHEEDRALLSQALRRLGCGESVYDLDLRGSHRDGHVIWMRIRAALGADDAIYLAAREITEEVRVTRDLARKERSFRQLLDDNRDALLVVSQQGRVQYANPAARTLLGAALGQRGAEIAALAARRGSDSTLFEWCLEGAHGENIDVEVLSSETDWDSTQMRLLSLRDVRLRKASEEELRVLKRALQASHNGVMIVDARSPGLPLIYANPAFGRISGYQPSETVGRNLNFLYGSAADQTAVRDIEQRLRDNQDVHAVMRNYRKDGTLFWCDLYVAPVRDAQGTVTHYICILRDVTDEKEAEQQLSYIANHDLLTDLPNRRLLEQRLREAGRDARAVGQGMAVVFVDLDGFKPINDSMGHLVGDAILVEVARRMRDHVRPRDLVARLSGDEFIVVLFDITHEQAERMTQRVIAAIAQPYEILGGTQHLTASAGLTHTTRALEDPMSLVQEADLAMYKAKHEGRNNFQWHTQDMSERVHERVRLRNELRTALATGQLHLHYQPKFERVTGRVAGIEALARWTRPERGPIPPAEFIRVAEETGQIVALGAWALETACAHNQWLRGQGLSNFCVAVNISPMQFQRRDFMAELKGTLHRTGLPPQALELEITEGVLLDDTERVIDILHELKELGVRVSIDDFGTGFSSLSYLKNLPIDYVKIDRSFVRDINVDSNDAAISKAIISMAHNLGLRVVAEGVETAAQMEFLKRYQCDEFQGYFLARPMPLDDLVRFLERMGNLN